MNSSGYLDHEPCRISFIGKDEKHASKVSLLFPVYMSVIAVLGCMCLLGILIPVWMAEIENLEKTSAEEFAAIRVRSEAAWKQLLQIESDDNSVAWARIRRKTDDEYNVYDYGRPLDVTNEASYSGRRQNPGQYMATPLDAGLSHDRYDKCCCNKDSVNIDSLTVSWSCPVGEKGPPGQRGPIGEPGENGQDGRHGMDYPMFGSESAQFYDGAPAALPHGYPYSVSSAYGSPPAVSMKTCEPCPTGPQGPPGPPGRTGNIGPKGMPGAYGRNGRHGFNGKPGPIGAMGPHGKTGYSGMPGTKGLDAFKGGKGAPGAKGRRGDNGVIGVRGHPGQNGLPGRPGYMGSAGDRGIKGQRGMDGMDGAPGIPGLPGPDGMYCPCPERSNKVQFSNDRIYNTAPTNYGSSQWSRQPAYPRQSSTPAPVYTRPPVASNQDYTRKIYVPERPGIPVATQRNFVTHQPPTTAHTRSTSSAPFSTDGSANEYDENAFLGKNVFASTATQKPWRTPDDEETYGLDVAWLENQRRHKQQKIA